MISWRKDELETRFTDILSTAEIEYGPRLGHWTTEISFGVSGPMITFKDDCLHSEILLPPETDMDLICYHLAHECVHLLSPAVQLGTNNFEEGAACVFASRYFHEVLGRCTIGPCTPSYIRAHGLMTKLLQFDNVAVKKIRERQPEMHKVSEEDILDVCPNAPPNLAVDLASPFPHQPR